MDKQKAAQEIAEKTAEAMRLVRECETIADEHDIDFSFDVAYGMGGTYGGSEGGWKASSQSC